MASNPNTNRPLGVGVIGAGGIFSDHARGLLAIPDRARLIAVADTSPARLRRACQNHFTPFACTDHRRLLDREDIDLVGIATPPNTHEALVTDALEAGKAVVCEKPLAPTLAATDRIIAKAAEYPGRLCVMHQLRYGRHFDRLKQFADRVGRIESASFQRLTNFGANAFGAGWWGRWQVAGGGVLMTQCIHQLDLMVQLLGRPTTVSATMATERQPIESEDTFEAEVHFDTSAILTCRGSLNADRNRLTYKLNGRGRSIEIRDGDIHGLPGRIWRKLSGGLRARLLGPPINPHGRLYADYVDALREGRTPPVPPDDARASVELTTAIYASALTGSTVSLPLHADAPCYEGITADEYRNHSASLPA